MDVEPTAEGVRRAIAEAADPADAVFLQRFFKTGAGQYGEGDVFIGVRVPATRAIVKRFRDLSLEEVDELLDSPVHEERLAGLLLLVARYPGDRAAVVDRYLAAIGRGRVDNWDLVDSSAEYILGDWLFERDRTLVFDLVASENLWERRIGVLTTFAFIRRGDSSTTLEVAARLLGDREDLIHKAVGWMLRETGKRIDPAVLTGFLDEYAARMPRTMLSYATEHLPAAARARYRALR